MFSLLNTWIYAIIDTHTHTHTHTVYPVLLAPWQIFGLTHAWCCHMHTYTHKWLETHDYRFTVVREIQLAEIQIFSLLVWDSRALAWTQLVSLPTSLSFSISAFLSFSPSPPSSLTVLSCWILCAVYSQLESNNKFYTLKRNGDDQSFVSYINMNVGCIEPDIQWRLRGTLNSYKALLHFMWCWLNIYRSERLRLYSMCSMHFCVCRLSNRQEGIREHGKTRFTCTSWSSNACLPPYIYFCGDTVYVYTEL